MAGAAISTSKPHGSWSSPASSTDRRASSLATSARNLLPAPADRNWHPFREVFAKSLRRAPPDPAESHAYNVVQRTAYLVVIFVLFPLIIWTGLALSPAFDSALPATVNLLGGRQSARTLHFFVTDLLVLFLIVHVAMISLAGFWSRMRAMITGRMTAPPERP